MNMVYCIEHHPLNMREKLEKSCVPVLHAYLYQRSLLESVSLT